MKFTLPILLLLVLATLLSSCGGGGGGGNNTEPWIEDVFKSSNEFENLCESPRTGSSQQTGQSFPDILGSTLHENNWLRSWTNETYLWYDEVIDRNPALYDDTLDYFDLLKTTEVTASGTEKDQFHFTASTEEYQALSQSGVSAGYGMQVAFLSRDPYEIAIVYTEPNTPASIMGIERGARIISIDGANAISPASQTEVDTLNAGLSPSNIDESHSFEVLDLGATNTRTVNLISAIITSTPVQNVIAIDTSSGKVGYMLFNDHIATSEALLIDAINQLSNESITDLVLDLRYNGGGFLGIASELAYMIAGETATNGRTFEALVFNDKHPVFDPITGERNDPIPFLSSAVGYSAVPGIPLPALDLDRVFILATGNTCSASESIINSLLGIDVDVILIGDTTCGKPYGFYPDDNCGTTYFSVQFQTENDQGFGDYADGFAPEGANSLGAVSLPGCVVSDDFDHLLSDTNEALLSTALLYRDTGSCSVSVSSTSGKLFSETNPVPTQKAITPKASWLQNRILDGLHE